MSHDLRPASRVTFSGRFGFALFALLSASIAALVAHIAIDVLGDYLLPHDSYDDVAHGSRSIVSSGVLTVLAGAAVRLLVAAFQQSGGPMRAKRAFARLDRRSLYGYLVLVVVMTCALLAGMELTDLLLAGQRVDDAGDLFGGSIAFAAGITLPVAFAVACGSWRIARWVTQVQGIAIRAIGAWLAMRARPTVAAGVRGRRRARFTIYAPALARSTSKRGPPTLLR